jgi:hypothetical protein
MDNLAAHKTGRIKELIEQQDCELLYLPPYSPDFNPIEEAFSKVKGFLWKAGARTREALVEALGAALEAVTAEDARGFFEHCGYTVPCRSNSYDGRARRRAVPTSRLLARCPPHPTKPTEPWPPEVERPARETSQGF